MHVTRFLARSTLGALFVGHGTQKLLGWFGGPGMKGTEQMMQSMNMHPPRRNALAVGVTETGGGALVVAGLGTPLAAASLIGVMTTAIRKVHLPNGVWNTQGGYEYNLTMIAALAALVETGPGKWSLDAALGDRLHGTRWALGALGLGVAASTAVIELGRRSAPPQHEAQEPSEGTGASAT